MPPEPAADAVGGTMQVVLPTHPLRAAALAVLAPAAILLAGCSAPAPAPPAPGDPAPAAATAPGGPTDASAGGHAGHGGGGLGLYAVQTAALGVVTTEGDGRLVYVHTADTPGTSACTGACAQEWLPLLLIEGTEPELLGVDAELVGELPREEGVQLTLAGRPLYHRADDSGTLVETDFAPHGTDGAWFAITPDGEPVPA